MKVYILHGWTQDRSSKDRWLPFIQELENRGFSPFFLALPGLLGKEINSPWDIDKYVSWLSRKLPSNEKAILLGHSFGGHVAVTFAALNPERVENLILISSSGLRLKNVFARSKRSFFMILAKIGKKISRSDDLRAFLHRAAREKDYLQASPVMRETMKLAISHDVTSLLSKIKTKTCIIWGSDDKVTPLSLGKVFAKQIKNSSINILSGERHSPHFTNPVAVAKKIEDFLNNTGAFQE